MFIATNPNKTYRYRYRDQSGKLLTVPVSQYKHLCHSLELMQKHLKIFEAKYDTLVKEREQRESWHDQYHNFEALLEVYIEKTMERSPRSWESKTAYFRFYVLPFFLNECRATKLEEWRLHFGAFRKFLKNTNQVRAKNKKLSLNSQNHCITELNNFLHIMANDTPPKCDPQPKCPPFQDKTDASLKGIEEVFTEEEIDKLFHFLDSKNKDASGLFLLLVRTGMRIQEALGLGVNNILKSKIPHKQLDDMLSSIDLGNYSIHIFFSRQLDNKSLIHDDEEARFAPLKSKPVIHERYMRYCPVWDNKLENILVEKMRSLKIDWQEKKYGDDKDQYLMFGRSITQSMLYNLFNDFYSSYKEYSRKTPHDCRHTASTYFATHDITGVLGKIILGQTEKTQKRYNHLNELMSRANSRKNKDVFDDF